MRTRAGGLSPALFLCVLAGLTTACARLTDALTSPQTRADQISGAAGFAPLRLAAGPFRLLGYERIDRPGAGLTVYVESDGRAWIDRSTLSPDPTPVRPLVLSLAVRDPAANRLYLARPCQFPAAGRPDASCTPLYWASGRFAPETIDAMADAVETVRRAAGAEIVTLVGYSGGGVVAALLAARQPQSVRLITIAAPLDHVAWTRHFDDSPLDRSLNPADFGAALQLVRQVHFIGLRDEVVPPAVLDSYLGRLPDRSRVLVVRLADQDHQCCWLQAWPTLRATAAAWLEN